MRVTLTYDGRLTSRPSADVKQSIRNHFHKQLKRLWEVNYFLKNWMKDSRPGRPVPMRDWIFEQKDAVGGIKFVPLVSRDFCLECALNVRLLRSTDTPGQQFDIDNLTKPLWDCLKSPTQPQDLGHNAEDWPEDEPFFVLLEDDDLISHLVSTSDELLEPISGQAEIRPNHVRVLIDAHIRPTIPGAENSIFFEHDVLTWDHLFEVPEDIANWSNHRLRSATTQCIFRIEALHENLENQRQARRQEFFAQDGDIEGLNDQVLRDGHEHHMIWNRGLRNKSFALKRELERRVFGNGDVPREMRSTAIDDAMLAGVRPLAEAAAILTNLTLLLP